MLAWLRSIEREYLCQIVQGLSPRIWPRIQLNSPVLMATSIPPSRPMALSSVAAHGRWTLDLFRSGRVGWTGAGTRSASTSARRKAGGEAVTDQAGEGPTEAAPEPVRKKKLSRAVSPPGEEPPAPGSTTSTKRKVKAPAKAQAGGGGPPATGPVARGGGDTPAPLVAAPHFDPASLTRHLPSGDGPWAAPRHWVAFSDLHVTAKTLSTCLQVRTRAPSVHAPAPSHGQDPQHVPPGQD